MKVLSLIVDTNIFVQCRPLEELGSPQWRSFDEVHFIVCRPVQRQIDNLKNRGNDRVGRRARRANALFREIITGNHNYKLIQATSPKVKLIVDPTLIRSSELADRLDYTEVDDQIVGCLHAFRSANPDADARLLTLDSGPMATAEMLSLPFETVPDDWLLPPEIGAAERERNQLRTEVDRLKNKEPRFRIACLDDSDRETESLTLEFVRYEPLSDTDVRLHLERIRSHFPLTRDFDAIIRAQVNRPFFAMVARGTPHYTPPSAEEIAAYTDHEYPGWLEECELRLRDQHTFLQTTAGQLGFCIVAENLGTRPGRDVLVRFAAKGNFEIRPIPLGTRVDGVDKTMSTTGTRRLSAPPVPPCGTWSATSIVSSDTTSTFAQIQPEEEPSQSRSSFNPVAPERDPNAFYLKDGLMRMAGSSFSVTCDQWRHGVGKKSFRGEIDFDAELQSIRGALECEIHADNLSDPLKRIFPITISVTVVNALESAIALADELITRVSD